MKTLLLMRHAKSSWKDTKLTDHERPLNKRGQKDAHFMGKVLLEKELLPQKIIASSAVRVRETVAGLVSSSGSNCETEFSDTFFMAESETYLAALRLLPDSLERVMVVGHNPGLEGLLQKLSGRVETLEAGTIAYLSLAIQNWGELTCEIEGDLIEVLHLHDLRNEKEDKKDEKKHKVQKKEYEKKHKEEKEVDKKKHKQEKATEAKKLKEEKELAEKIRIQEKAAEAIKIKEAKKAAEKILEEEKAAEAKRLNEEKQVAEKIRKEEKKAAEKIRKVEKSAEMKRRKEEKESAVKKSKAERQEQTKQHK